MAKETLDTEGVRQMMLAVADAIIAAEPELTDADRNLGDGDHGLGMQRGLTAAKEKLEEGGFAGVDKVISAVGMAMMTSMGGASGAIFGTMFRNGGKALKGREELDSEGLALMLEAGAEGVMTRGGAKPGDKTMIDSLVPAAEKARECSGETLADAAAAVAQAGEDGREASKALVATMGRAKTLGEKSVGHPDAGACSVAIILRTMADFVKRGD